MMQTASNAPTTEVRAKHITRTVPRRAAVMVRADRVSAVNAAEMFDASLTACAVSNVTAGKRVAACETTIRKCRSNEILLELADILDQDPAVIVAVANRMIRYANAKQTPRFTTDLCRQGNALGVAAGEVQSVILLVMADDKYEEHERPMVRRAVQGLVDVAFGVDEAPVSVRGGK